MKKTIKKSKSIKLVSRLLCLTSNNYRTRLKLYPDFKDSHFPRFISNSNNSNILEDTPTSIKVVSYNIKFAKQAPKATELIQNHKDLQDADILMLQEMNAASVAQMARTLNMNYVYYPAIMHPYTDKDFGNAVLSKWPLIKDYKILLPNPKKNARQRIAVCALIQLGKKTVKVYSLHMPIFLNAQNKKELLEHILSHEKNADHHIIIGGDFNTFTKTSRKEINTTFEDANFDHATHGIGWTHKHLYFFLNNKNTLDFIFTRGLFTCKTGKVINRKASDHLPIWADLKFEN